MAYKTNVVDFIRPWKHSNNSYLNVATLSMCQSEDKQSAHEIYSMIQLEFHHDHVAVLHN